MTPATSAGGGVGVRVVGPFFWWDRRDGYGLYYGVCSYDLSGYVIMAYVVMAYTVIACIVWPI